MTTTLTAPPSYTPLDDFQSPLTILLKGPSGTGKTTKIGQFPRPAIFTFDNNLTSLAKLPASVRRDIKVFNPRVDKNGKLLPGEKVWDRYLVLLEEAMNMDNVDSVWTDSVSTLSGIIEDVSLKSSKPESSMEIQNWKDFYRYMRWLMEECCTKNSLRKHMGFTAHESNVYGKPASIGAQGDLLKIEIAMSSKFKDNMELYFTDVWRTQVKVSPTGIEYMVNTRPSALASAKSSLKCIGKEVPDIFNWDKDGAKVIAEVNNMIKGAA